MGLFKIVVRAIIFSSKILDHMLYICTSVSAVAHCMIVELADILRISIYRFRASVSGDCFSAKTSMLLRAIVRVTKC